MANPGGWGLEVWGGAPGVSFFSLLKVMTGEENYLCCNLNKYEQIQLNNLWIQASAAAVNYTVAFGFCRHSREANLKIIKSGRSSSFTFS